MLFDIANLGDINKPLTPKILRNPQHKITKHILYLYSMESFIYGDLNQACREKDESKIKYYGAFAAALGYILNNANQQRKNGKLSNTTILYRGLKLYKDQIKDYQVGEKKHIMGYTSTSKRFGCALKFAQNNL